MFKRQNALYFINLAFSLPLGLLLISCSSQSLSSASPTLIDNPTPSVITEMPTIAPSKTARALSSATFTATRTASPTRTTRPTRTASPTKTLTITPTATLVPSDTPEPSPTPIPMNYQWKCWNGGDSNCSRITNNQISSLAFGSDNTAWIVGRMGFIGRWDGQAWEQIASPITTDLNDIFFLAPDNGWAVGEDAVILHWDGSQWAISKPPDPAQAFWSFYFEGISFVHPENGWAVGGVSSEGGGSPYAFYWDGKNWQKAKIPECDSDCRFNDIEIISGQIWIASSQGIFHWNGARWKNYLSGDFYSVSGISPDEVWVVDRYGRVSDWDGQEWKTIQSPYKRIDDAVKVFVLEKNSVLLWAGGRYSGSSTPIYHWDGQEWKAILTSDFGYPIIDVKHDPQGQIGGITQSGVFIKLEYFVVENTPVPPTVDASLTLAPPQACPGAPPIMLAVGQMAVVNANPPLPSRIREQPDLQSSVLGQAQPGELVTIIDGPRCADNYTWWKVQLPNGVIGWAAEGDNSTYWLIKR